jgi:CPA2 family monovalent cation:H+ antiporter-2
VIRIVQDQRDARYNLLRGFFRGSDDDTADELQHERLTSITLPQDAKASGSPTEIFALHGLKVRVVSIRSANGNGNGKVGLPDSNTVLRAGDTIVLSGKAEALAAAEHMLLNG